MGKKNDRWGGKRLNAGIPRIEGGRRVLVTLKPEHIEIATLLGNGNMASGVRKALELVPNGTKRSKS